MLTCSIILSTAACVTDEQDQENAAAASPQASRTGRIVKIASTSTSASTSQSLLAPQRATSPHPFQSTSAPLSPLRAGSSRANNNTLIHALQQVQDSPNKDVKGKSKARAIVIDDDDDAGADENEEPTAAKKTKASKLTKAAAAAGKKKKVAKKERPAAAEPIDAPDDDEMDVFVDVPSLDDIDRADAEEAARRSAASSRQASPVEHQAVDDVAAVEVEDAPEAQVEAVAAVVDEEDEEAEVGSAVGAALPEDVVLPASEPSAIEEDVPALAQDNKSNHSRSTTTESTAAPAAVQLASPPIAAAAPPAKEDTIDSSSPPRASRSPAQLVEHAAPEPIATASTSSSAQPTAAASTSAKVPSWPAQRSTAAVGLRSSWLSKALGGDGQEGLRKSQGAALVAASREREKEREEQIAATATAGRTSGTLAVSGLSSSQKRKSGAAFADASSTSIDQSQSQSQPDEANGRAAKYQRANDIAASAHRLSTLPSASNIPGRLPILFSPPSNASTAADNQSGISRLKKEIEELAARNARTRALSSLGGPSLPPAPAPASLRMSLAQRGAPLADVGESEPHSPSPKPSPKAAIAVAEVVAPAVTPAVEEREIAEDESDKEAELDEDEDEIPEPPMPDLATPFDSPVRELLPPPPMVVAAPQLPLTPPPAPVAAKKSLLVQQPVVAPAAQPAAPVAPQAAQEKPVVPEVFPFPSSPIEAPKEEPVKVAPAAAAPRPRPAQPAPIRQQPAPIHRMPERTAPAAPPSRQHNRQPTTPVQADRHSAALNLELGSTTPSQTPPPKSKVPVPTSKLNKEQPQEAGDLSIEDLVMTSEKANGKQDEMLQEDAEDQADDEQDEDANMSKVSLDALLGSRAVRVLTHVLSRSLCSPASPERARCPTLSPSLPPPPDSAHPRPRSRCTPMGPSSPPKHSARRPRPSPSRRSLSLRRLPRRCGPQTLSHVFDPPESLLTLACHFPPSRSKLQRTVRRPSPDSPRLVGTMRWSRRARRRRRRPTRRSASAPPSSPSERQRRPSSSERGRNEKSESDDSKPTRTRPRRENSPPQPTRPTRPLADPTRSGSLRRPPRAPLHPRRSCPRSQSPTWLPPRVCQASRPSRLSPHSDTCLLPPTLLLRHLQPSVPRKLPTTPPSRPRPSASSHLWGLPSEPPTCHTPNPWATPCVPPRHPAPPPPTTPSPSSPNSARPSNPTSPPKPTSNPRPSNSPTSNPSTLTLTTRIVPRVLPCPLGPRAQRSGRR